MTIIVLCVMLIILFVIALAVTGWATRNTPAMWPEVGDADGHPGSSDLPGVLPDEDKKNTSGRPAWAGRQPVQTAPLIWRGQCRAGVIHPPARC